MDFFLTGFGYLLGAFIIFTVARGMLWELNVCLWNSLIRDIQKGNESIKQKKIELAELKDRYSQRNNVRSPKTLETLNDYSDKWE